MIKNDIILMNNVISLSLGEPLRTAWRIEYESVDVSRTKLPTAHIFFYTMHSVVVFLESSGVAE